MDERLEMPHKLLRQVTVFVILFSFGGGLKSIFFNDLNFSPQDCIGASITVSILMYMELYNRDVCGKIKVHTIATQKYTT